MQCYKYRVGEYIAEGPKRNYWIYRRKCWQTSAIYRQNKKYKNIKKYKNSKNYYVFEKIGKYRHKIGKYRDQIGKKSPKNQGKYWVDISLVSWHRDISRCCRYISDVCNTATESMIYQISCLKFSIWMFIVQIIKCSLFK